MEPIEIDVPLQAGWEHVIYGKGQPAYSPLPAHRSLGPYGEMVTRWRLSDEERQAVAEGGDIYLKVLTFQKKLQPLQVGVFCPVGLPLPWWRLVVLQVKRWLTEPTVWPGFYGFGRAVVQNTPAIFDPAVAAVNVNTDAAQG